MPAVSTRSLWATGRPCSTPSGPPRAESSSARAASASARSATSVTIALTFGLIRSMRARWAVITSRADTSLRRMRAASSMALRSQSSSPLPPVWLLLVVPPPAAPAARACSVPATAPSPSACPNVRRVTGRSFHSGTGCSLRLLLLRRREGLLHLLPDVLVVLVEQLLFVLCQDPERHADEALRELHVEP